jgi:cation diffusion facilitator CzcD-associated flavoprotein CzcO
LLVHGFPNFLMPSGPQSGSASTNYPRGIETGVSWCTRFLRYMWAHGYTRAEPTIDAEKRWTDHPAMAIEDGAWFNGHCKVMRASRLRAVNFDS